MRDILIVLALVAASVLCGAFVMFAGIFAEMGQEDGLVEGGQGRG